MPNLISGREKTIGERERAFNLRKQICTEAARWLAHLNRLATVNPSERFRIGKQILAAETRFNDDALALENAATELREAYSLRGGALPQVDTRIVAETETGVVEEEGDLARHFRLESALRKAEEDLIPFATKLAVTTAFATEQVLKEQPEPTIVEPATLSEKVVYCELKINHLRSEIDYITEQVRPWRLTRNSSRLGELRTEMSPEVKFAEESLTARKAELSQMTAQHRALLAEMRSQPNHAANQMGTSQQAAKTLANASR
jgi:hypothetical protein